MQEIAHFHRVSKRFAKALFAGLLFLLVLVMAPAREPGAGKGANYADCLTCHQGIERISENHASDCATCHLPPGVRRRRILKNHEVIVRNPSDPAVVRIFCIRCHEREIEQVESSLHGSMAGVINQTRYLWGAQKQASPALYGLSGPFRPMPEPDPEVYPDKPADLVDDFLRRRCLRCHIHQEGASGAGLYRASGCAACHVLYGNDGHYRGLDRAVHKSLTGYPIRHEFTVRIPNTQCLHCHNQNHAGADYEGLFEHDYSSTYRSPIIGGEPHGRLYGQVYHRLIRDVHAERGLWCTDCHGRNEVMGDGKAYSFEMEAPGPVCERCHGGYGRQRPDVSLESVREESGLFLFFSKNNNREYRLREFRQTSTGHRVPAHSKVRCSACHAQWSYQDYGLSVIREDRIEEYKWYGLAAQGDPELEGILNGFLEGSGGGDPLSRDRISGQLRLGIWSMGWRFRRWEFMPLGIDNRGKYTILRPLYQYLITYVDRLGNVPLDSMVPSRGDGSGAGWAFMPYVPHTIAPSGRSCDACHMNRLAVGLGVQEEMTMDTRLTVPSPPAIKGARLLDAEERRRLLEPSYEWRKERLRSLMEISLISSF